jgi:predicted RNA binding protein YcfA (HicA-like mRNA interferase family)
MRSSSNYPWSSIRSVKRRDLVRHFESHGFYLLREGANHSIYCDGNKAIPI